MTLVEAGASLVWAASLWFLWLRRVAREHQDVPLWQYVVVALVGGVLIEAVWPR